jgi:hypothetical protein
VRRLFGWIAGLVGIAALARVLARRSRAANRESATVEGEDPAEALRRKLSESRDAPAAQAEEAHAPAPTPKPEPTETLEERRARVHAKAQEALDAMEATQAAQEPGP